jgi:hypothetical protein
LDIFKVKHVQISNRNSLDEQGVLYQQMISKPNPETAWKLLLAAKRLKIYSLSDKKAMAWAISLYESMA